MKKTAAAAALLASSIAAASGVLFSAPSEHLQTVSDEKPSSQEETSWDQTCSDDQSTDKFAPRFDGLRFIETLVTAHR